LCNNSPKQGEADIRYGTRRRQSAWWIQQLQKAFRQNPLQKMITMFRYYWKPHAAEKGWLSYFHRLGGETVCRRIRTVA
jgi:hypothetical protein